MFLCAYMCICKCIYVDNYHVTWRLSAWSSCSTLYILRQYRLLNKQTWGGGRDGMST